MFKTEHYRKQAAQNGEHAEHADVPEEKHEFQRMDRSLNLLTNNEKWLADNFEKTLHASGDARSDTAPLAPAEEQLLRCLGAAVIMQWNTIPTKLQRELFDTPDRSAICCLRWN
jgi:hypothetical protein